MSILDPYWISQSFARDPALLLHLAGASPAPRRPFLLPRATGRVSKRKPRPSKRLPTTYIVADPANFREMVQHVTGVRADDPEAPVEPAVEPEAKRVETAESCFVPTLDTSALLLDRDEKVGPEVVVSASVEPDRFELDPFVSLSYPTLETWGAM
ncbi:calmodulin-binding protein 25-like [Typha latifolia]|uniref:calmodulin-binding protein 25-like n=1 Tax=Typha latifolia TaxID=4733 RepID=UPI003C2EF12A